MSWRLVVLSAPRTKKTSNRVVRAGTHIRILPSQAFKNWEEVAVPQMRLAWGGKPPLCQPVNVSAVVYRDAARGDLIGFLQAIADALQVAQIVTDDRWIQGWDNCRLDKDAQLPRVELEITEMP